MSYLEAVRICKETVGHRLHALLLATFLLIPPVIAGCQPGTGPSPTGQQEKDLARTQSVQAAGAAPAESSVSGQTESDASVAVGGGKAITLKVVDRAQFEELLKSLRGKVVLVDFWATWCVPCIEMFPHTVQWHRKYADRGLACVSVSFDDPGEDGQNERTLQFLKDHDATFVNLISRYGADAKSFEEFDIGGGGIPHYKLYDRQGNLVGAFGNDDPNHPLDPEELEQLIVATLEKGQ